MKICKSSFANRIAFAKIIGLFFWILWFVLLPFYFPNVSTLFSWWVLFWYATIGGIIGLMWVMTKHPIFGFRLYPFVRGGVIWWWMCFIFALIAYNDLVLLMQWTFWEHYSPFWIITEWVIVWGIIDSVTTKCCGEWKKLLIEN